MTTESNNEMRSADVPEYYADSLNMNISPYGFGLEFGLVPFPEGGPVGSAVAGQDRANPVVRVRVSPQMAQAVKLLLIEQMKRYESIFGAVVVPDTYSRLEEAEGARDEA